MEEDVTVANGLLLKFGEHMQRIYGEDAITPNMHMACHIAECILDYGPLHSFWLFAFECYNGLLGSQPNNNRAIEGQLMARFLKDSVHFHLMHSLNTKPLFEHFGPVVCANTFEKSELVEKNKNNEHVSTGLLQEPPKYNLHVLSDTDCLELKQVYCKYYLYYNELPGKSQLHELILSCLRLFLQDAFTGTYTPTSSGWYTRRGSTGIHPEWPLQC